MNISLQPRIFLALLAAVGVLAMDPARANAAIQVSSNGVDSGLCGQGDAAPCATIGQAVANAADGDAIVVGPGVYPGFSVVKTVSLYSGAGTGAAIINGPVTLAAAGVRFGKRGKGFSVTGSTLSITGDDVAVRGNLFSNSASACVDVTAGAGAVVRDNGFDNCVTGLAVSNGVAAEIRANRFGHCSSAAVNLGVTSSGAIVRDNRISGIAGAGIFLGGSGHLLWRNLVHGMQIGVVVTTGVDIELDENEVVGSSGPGFQVTGGSGWVLRGNAASNNAAPGFVVSGVGEVVLEDNTAIGNMGYGFLFNSSASGLVLEGNSALQNSGEGLVLNAITTSVTVRGGNLYGNGGGNCGLVNASTSSVTTEDVYWGAAAPGPDPADAICGNVPLVVVGSPASAPNTIRMPAIK